MLIAPDLFIDEAAISVRFVRASGPGGQNVNKVATAVELRFDTGRAGLAGSAFLARLAVVAGRRMTGDGVIVLHADRFRTQEQNRSDARARLAGLLAQAARPPKPRVRTRIPRRTREARLGDKHQRATVKKDRGTVSIDGDR